MALVTNSRAKAGNLEGTVEAAGARSLKLTVPSTPNTPKHPQADLLAIWLSATSARTNPQVIYDFPVMA